MNVIVTLNEEKGKKNISYPTSKKIVVGCSCIDNEEGVVSECSPYKAIFEKGIYLIECFGASGTNLNNGLSLGGYTSGIIKFSRQTTLYLYIGEQGKYNGPSSFNGGGKGNRYSFSGGGATDIRIIGGNFDNDEGLRSRIMVASGGGGQSIYNTQYYNGQLTGNGGGFNGEKGNIQFRIEGETPTIVLTNAEGGTQSKGGLGGINPGDDEPPHSNYVNSSSWN